ncbi:MAG TPA: helix-turn-helix transcriptional regulator [Amycolatopsis sp.]|nr:helix-turn-helix transcriptional regulator [Amycolatopsis sp.]
MTEADFEPPGHAPGTMGTTGGLPEPIGPLIRLARRERGLTQYQLADALAGVSGNDGIGRDEVSRWERGKRVPGPYWRHWLARVLDLSPDRLHDAAQTARALRSHSVRPLFSPPPGSSESLGRVGS